MTDPRTIAHLRAHRERAGLSQASLAERASVSRQALVAIEAGRQVPSTSLALVLARVLGCAVEDLFELRTDGLPVAVAPLPAWATDVPAARGATRVAVGRVGDAWVAHRLIDDAGVPADGLLLEAPLGGVGRVELLVDERDVERHALVAGCAPLLGALAARVGRRHRDARATYLSANSERALELLRAGHVHVAGLHLAADDAPDAHEALVRARLPGHDLHLVHLTRWRVGLAVARGNAKGIRTPADLIRPDVRFVAREDGAGTTQLVRRLLAGVGAAAPASGAGPMAADHAAVAELVRGGGADVGVTIESAALTAGLDFVALVEERFDLVVMRDHLDLPPVARFLELLDDPTVRAETARLPGYDGAQMGRTTTIEARTASRAVRSTPA